MELHPVWGMVIIHSELAKRLTPISEEVNMKVAKRLVVAIGSIVALLLAGGANWKIG